MQNNYAYCLLQTEESVPYMKCIISHMQSFKVHSLLIYRRQTFSKKSEVTVSRMYSINPYPDFDFAAVF